MNGILRVDGLKFDKEIALYRGDGSGAALVSASGPFPAFARVDVPGAGVPSGYLHLEVHSSDIVVYAIDESADAVLRKQPYVDDRFRSVGSYLDAPDLDTALEEDARLAAKSRAPVRQGERMPPAAVRRR